MSDWVDVTTLVSALACGLVAGVWFAFSSFVMQALARLPAAQGVATMQSINRTVLTPVFMTTLFGAALVCAVMVGWAAFNWSDARAPWVLAGGVVYIVGTIGVTIGGNVPLNDAVDRLAPDSDASRREWPRFLAAWTKWNHVRLGGSLAAAALLTIALMQD